MLSAFAVYNSKMKLKDKPQRKKTEQRTRIRKRPNVNKKIPLIKDNESSITKKRKKVNQKNTNLAEKNQRIVETAKEVFVNNNIESKNVILRKRNPASSPKIVQKRKKTTKLLNSKVKISEIIHPPQINEVDSDILKKPTHLLNYLLAPIKISEFFNIYWETKPLHLVRNKTDYFKNILSSKQIDTILRENLLYYTKNVDVVTYENGIRQTHNPEGRAIPGNVWDYYLNGCSIRIMNPQTYNQKIRDLLSTLQEYFGTMVGVNVYLTPPGSQGFAPHYDDIEAFVIQLEGHKNWKLYAPRNHKEILPRCSSHNLARDELEAPIKELTLQAGDLLYFPRGVIHEASTDSDAHSLHITVSVYQNTAYVDLLEKLLPQALKTASENNINFRKGLPLNYLKHVGLVNSDKQTLERKQILSNVKELMHKLVDYASIDMAADHLGRKFMYDALPPNLSSSEKLRSSKEDGDRMENGIVKNIVSFNPDTLVRLTRYHTQRLVLDDTPKIYYCTENANVYHGEDEQYLELEDMLIDVVKTLQNKYPEYISIESLPCDDEIKKIQTIGDLWERGLIVTKEPLDIEDE